MPAAHHPEPRPRAPCYSDAPPPVAWQEAGFGKYESFNQVVRHIFSDQARSTFGVAGPRMPFELEPPAMDEQLRHAAQVIQRHARRFIA